MTIEMPNLESKLKSHDWFYAYSDDQSYWRKGSEESKEITRLMELARIAGDGAAAAALYNEHNPYAQPSWFEHAERISEMYLDEDGTYSVRWYTKEEYEVNNVV